MESKKSSAVKGVNVRPLVYTVAEVATLLRTSAWNVYEMIRRDEIPGVIRLGTKIRLLRESVNRWLGAADESVTDAVRDDRSAG
jgi:excisionase family DNA binding protein